MLKHRILATVLLAVTSLACWAATSGGQEEPAVGRRAVIVSQPAAPAVPGTPAAVPPPIGVPGHGADVLFHIQRPIMEALDEETRALHEQDQAHEQSARQLIQQYRAAESGTDRSDLQEKLATTVREHFETRQQLREKELAALEARVRRLRELHDKREDAKDEIVEQRIDQLIREAEGLGWSNGGEHATFPNLPGPGVLNPQIRGERIELRAPRVSR